VSSGHPHTDAELQTCVDALAQYGKATEAALRLNLNRASFNDRVRDAWRRKIKPSKHIEDLANPLHLNAKIKRLEHELRKSEDERLDHTLVKSKIIQLGHNVAETEAPPWMVKPQKSADCPGVPTVMVSDLHWAEVVDPKQINFVNKYNIEIAHDRLKRLAERTIRLLGIISPKFDYPGIVIPFGGDMITGNIHDELTATNEMNSMPAILDLFGALASLIETFLQKFPHVFIPCVTGNHGRDTRKIWSKDRHHTSFDWLLYCFLAKHFEKNERVTFHIPDGPDAYYRIYDHRYLLTHGDQFRGGDGVIGPLGPIIRGDHRKRSRNSQISQEYDTMIMGHFHSYMQMERLIVNGSLKGYDEYAYAGMFPFEVPQQALWLTHPKHRITYRMPVKLTEIAQVKRTSWVSVAA
jgi:hypothetical protein